MKESAASDMSKDNLLDMMAMKSEVADNHDTQNSREIIASAESMSSDEKPPRLTEQVDSESSSDELNSGYKLVMDIIIEEVLESEEE